MRVLDYFFDPVLRGPTVGSIFLGISAAIVGVILFLNKKSLLSETLSHTSYPGVVLSMVFLGYFSIYNEAVSFFIALAGAFFTSYLSIYLIRILCENFKVSNDAALCFVLSSFFGFGLLIASHIQISMSFWYRKIQSFLFGQSATMQDVHIWVYFIVCFFLLFFVISFYRKLQVFLFDKNYARSIGINPARLEKIIFFFLVLTIVVGIRSVGVVLMSALLIIPSVFAVPLTNRLSSFFMLAAFSSAFFAFAGNVLSVELSRSFKGLSFPTGPLIVLIGALFGLLSFFLSPQKGLIARWIRIGKFKKRCLQENILKAVIKSEEKQTSLKGLQVFLPQIHHLKLRKSLRRMQKDGWIKNENQIFSLTSDGEKKALYIIRLHRLWELYLNNKIGVAKEKVHQSAEIMEHILTPDLEEKLGKLLSDPKKDPHKQPIPEKFL